MQLTAALNTLYKSEINCQISSEWDDGWTVRIGDGWNGYSAEKRFEWDEVHLIAEWLLRAVSPKEE